MEDMSEIVAACRFDTDRLRVEAWADALRDDSGGRAALMAALRGLLTPVVTRHLPEPLRLGEGAEAVEQWVAARDAESAVFTVRDRETKTLLGLLILAPMEDAPGELTMRLGFLLAKAAWGQGYATELVHGLVAWCEKQGLSGELIGGVEPENKASAAVLTKAGFSRVGEMVPGEAETFRLVL